MVIVATLLVVVHPREATGNAQTQTKGRDLMPIVAICPECYEQVVTAQNSEYGDKYRIHTSCPQGHQVVIKPWLVWVERTELRE